MVVNRTSSSLDGRVRAEIEVILIRMSDVALNKSTRQGVSILVSSLRITILGEETDVMALGADGDSPLDLFDCEY